MTLSEAKLIKKTPLTHDVYELHYKLGENKTMLAGQFITFILSGIGGRAYSVANLKNQIATLIIKKWSKKNGGRGGSIYLCDSNVGDSFKYVGPTGHFVLSKNNTSRCFLGTGTGLVPLYSQIIEALKGGDDSDLHLVFGVRTKEDLFYIQNIENISKKYKNFSYSLFLSRDNTKNTQKGYVTDFLTPENTQNFQEYYICGAPAMIESCQEKLTQLGIRGENIFFEKY